MCTRHMNPDEVYLLVAITCTPVFVGVVAMRKESKPSYPPPDVGLSYILLGVLIGDIKHTVYR